MAHAYDTGLAKPQRTLIRQAVMARLALLKKPALYLQAVAALPLKIQGRSDEEGLGFLALALNGAAPALAVVLGRGDVAAAGQNAAHARKTIELVVYVVSNNVRGLVDGRLAGDAASAASDSADPGIETMVEHVEQMLLGFDLGIDGVEEIRPVSEDELATGQDVTIWEVVFSIRVDRSINHDRSITQLLLDIETRNRVDGSAAADDYVTRTALENDP
jgi:hypothetical protein